jgi:hypothetical protein
MPSLAQARRSWGRRKPPSWARLDRSHPISVGAAGEWPLNEAAGSRIYDKTGNNLTLTAVNGPTWVGAQVGIGLQFTSASSQYLTLPNSSLISPGNTSFTWAYWVNFATVTAQPRVVCKTDSGGAGDYFMGLDSTAHVLFLQLGNGNFVNASSAGAPAANTWYFVIQWLDAVAAKLNIQVNNGPVDQAAAGTPTATSQSLAVGSFNDHTVGFLNGKLAHLAYWRRVLSAGERAALYRAPFARYQPAAPKRIRTRPLYAGAAAATLGALALAAAGSAAAPVYATSAAPALGSMSVSAAGSFTAPVYSGAAAPTLGTLTLAAAGTAGGPLYPGADAATLGAMTLTAAGVFSSLDLRQAIRSYLTADAALAGLVGTRIRPGGFSEADPMPAVTYTVISQAEDVGLNGAVDMAWARVQFDCWSRTLSHCVLAKGRLRDLLHGYSGAMGGLQIVRSKRLEPGEVDLHEPPADGTDSWLYHISTDYRIKFVVLAPAP